MFFSHAFNSDILGGGALQRRQSWLVGGFFIRKDSHHENEHIEKGEAAGTAILQTYIRET